MSSQKREEWNKILKKTPNAKGRSFVHSALVLRYDWIFANKLSFFCSKLFKLHPLATTLRLFPTVFLFRYFYTFFRAVFVSNIAAHSCAHRNVAARSRNFAHTILAKRMKTIAETIEGINAKKVQNEKERTKPTPCTKVMTNHQFITKLFNLFLSETTK